MAEFVEPIFLAIGWAESRFAASRKLFSGGRSFRGIGTTGWLRNPLVMIGQMLAIGKHFKVFGAIIRLVPILMVNNFKREWLQFSSKNAFHNVPMLENQLALAFDTNVSGFGQHFGRVSRYDPKD